jgi:hypothetical protein
VEVADPEPELVDVGPALAGLAEAVGEVVVVVVVDGS